MSELVTNLREHLLNRPGIEAGDVLDVYLQAPVVVIGPGETTAHDPSLFAAAYLLAKRGGGRLMIADPQKISLPAGDVARYQGRRNHPGRIISGLGGVQKHIAEIEAFRDCGIPCVIPEWLSEESGIHNIPLQDNSVRTIIDHSTSIYLSVNLPRPATSRQKENFLREAYMEYARVLSMGGRLLLQTSSSADTNTLWRILEESGFDIRKYFVRDSFTIPVSSEVIGRLPVLYGETRMYPVEGATALNIRKRGDKSYDIRLKPSTHSSPVFFVCRKVKK